MNIKLNEYIAFFKHDKLSQEILQLNEVISKISDEIGYFKDYISEYNQKINELPLLEKIIFRKKYNYHKNYYLRMIDGNKKQVEIKIKELAFYQEELDIKKQEKQKIEVTYPNILNYSLKDILDEIIIDEDGICTVTDKTSFEFEQYVGSKLDNSLLEKDIALIHATDFFPKDQMILTPFESGYKAGGIRIINGVVTYFETYSPRNTIHFALNTHVGGHSTGDWRDKKFVIIEPFIAQKDKIVGIGAVDTWTIGSVKLSEDAVILVENDEYDKLSQKEKQEYTIIKFKGDSYVCTQVALAILGYKPQQSADFSWRNKDNYVILMKLMESLHPNLVHGVHFHSFENSAEFAMRDRDTLLMRERGTFVDTRDGMEISIDELDKLWEKYTNGHQSEIDSFMTAYPRFLMYYGVRNIDNKFTLLSYKKHIEEYANSIYIDEHDKERAKILVKKLTMESHKENNSNQ